MSEKCFCHIVDGDGNKYEVKDAYVRDQLKHTNNTVERYGQRINVIEGRLGGTLRKITDIFAKLYNGERNTYSTREFPTDCLIKIYGVHGITDAGYCAQFCIECKHYASVGGTNGGAHNHIIGTHTMFKDGAVWTAQINMEPIDGTDQYIIYPVFTRYVHSTSSHYEENRSYIYKIEVFQYGSN